MNRLFFMLVLLCFIVSCSARDVQETFLRANKLYQDGECEKALNIYDSIERKGCATWYNMGNCAFKLNRHVDSLVYWRRARHHATKQELVQLAEHIESVHEILGKETNGRTFGQAVDNFLERHSLLFFQVFFLFVWLVLFVGLFFMRRRRKGAVVLLLPIAVVFGVLLLMKHRLLWYPAALVVKPATTVFAGPDSNYHTVGTAACADELRVVEKRGNWYKVRAKGLAGWVLADTLEVV